MDSMPSIISERTESRLSQQHADEDGFFIFPATLGKDTEEEVGGMLARSGQQPVMEYWPLAVSYNI
jgi:hypothetical protein